MPGIISKIQHLLTPDVPAGVVGAAPIASDLDGNAEWSPSAAALLPDVLPVAGTLLSYGGSRQLQSGGTVTHGGHFLFSPNNQYDIGNGTYDPRTVRAATSFIGPNTGDTAPWLRASGATSGIGIQDDRTSIWRFGTRLFSVGGEGVCAYNVSPIGLSRTQTPMVYLYCEADATIGLTYPDGSTYGTLNAAAIKHPSAALTLGNSTYGVTVPGSLFTGGTDYSRVNIEPYSTTYSSVRFNSYLNAGSWTTGATGYGAALLFERQGGGGLSIQTTSASQTGGVANSLLDRLTIGHGGTAPITVSTNAYLSFAGTNTPYIQASGGLLYFGVGGSQQMNLSTTAATFSGDISMRRTDAQGFIYAYATNGTSYIRSFHNGTMGQVQSSVGKLWLQGATGISLVGLSGDVDIAPSSGNVYIAGSGGNGTFVVYDADASHSTRLANDGTNGILSTSLGALYLSPNSGEVYTANIQNASATLTLGNSTYGITSPGGLIMGGNKAIRWGSTDILTVYNGHTYLDSGNGYNIVLRPTTPFLVCLGGVTSSYPALQYSGSTLKARLADNSADAPFTCAAITASGAIQETYRTSSLDPSTSDIGSGKAQRWWNSTASEFRDWANVGGSLYKSAAYSAA